MYLRFYNAKGRKLGYSSTTPATESKDRQWGINYFKGRVTKIVTQVNGKPVRTHIIITRKIQENK